MPFSTPRRLILDAAIDRSVIHGTLIAPTGDRREFHGWLELNTALEAMLATGADHPPNDSTGESGAAPAKAPATGAASGEARPARLSSLLAGEMSAGRPAGGGTPQSD